MKLTVLWSGVLGSIWFSSVALAAPPPIERIPQVLAVTSPLSAAPAGTTDVKFGEFFKMPVGPRGLEPTEKLLALNGKKIRLVGFMVRQDVPTKGMFVFAPMPLELGDADESLSDDLPPSTVFVHIATPAQADIAYIPAMIKLTGTLQIGAQNETDGHVSSIRLLLDDAPARAIVKQVARPDSKFKKSVVRSGTAHATIVSDNRNSASE